MSFPNFNHIWLLPFFAGSKCKSLFLQARARELDGSSLMAGRPPSGSGDLLGPQPSSEVEQLEAPADRRPLRNVLRARPSSEVCWRCCGPCPARSHPKRTPARIAHLLPSMRHARASPSLIIPTWQACPPRSGSELYIIFLQLLKCHPIFADQELSRNLFSEVSGAASVRCANSNPPHNSG